MATLDLLLASFSMSETMRVQSPLWLLTVSGFSSSIWNCGFRQ